MGIAACQSDSGGYALDNLFVPKQQNANYTYLYRHYAKSPGEIPHIQVVQQ